MPDYAPPRLRLRIRIPISQVQTFNEHSRPSIIVSGGVLGWTVHVYSLSCTGHRLDLGLKIPWPTSPNEFDGIPITLFVNIPHKLILGRLSSGSFLLSTSMSTTMQYGELHSLNWWSTILTLMPNDSSSGKLRLESVKDNPWLHVLWEHRMAAVGPVEGARDWARQGCVRMPICSRICSSLQLYSIIATMQASTRLTQQMWAEFYSPQFSLPITLWLSRHTPMVSPKLFLAKPSRPTTFPERRS